MISTLLAVIEGDSGLEKKSRGVRVGTAGEAAIGANTPTRLSAKGAASQYGREHAKGGIKTNIALSFFVKVYSFIRETLTNRDLPSTP